ncbi:EGF domain-specific O-linked N-acetylglucosamine transferase [Atheta coriaria]|uniref:EGF domain-specific O-linked N-acetylglucosamine transferase n=1 Tax=Dalotia coriaria TaxID=877792 RepID=UPI0031F33B52
MEFLAVFFLFLCTPTTIYTLNYTFINLPDEHLRIYFSQHKDISQICIEDPDCPYHQFIDLKNENTNKCWGYEQNCNWQEQNARPHCPGDHRGWVKTKKNQEETFFTQADFGYVKQQIAETHVLCEALFPMDSSLECSKHMRFCRGRNLMINFTDLAHREEPLRYKMDVLKQGQIGGFCKLHRERLQEYADHLSPLQSWGPEMRFFDEMTERPMAANKCDVIIDKPTFIMKIDATVNMYHHFCDFVNLYASQHLNSTHYTGFDQDINILIWETYTYNSAFKDVFKVFTKNPILDLKTFRGEVVCFKNIVFPLLPRMIFGLYYNTPIIYGCEESSLFKAFAEHVLHRLEIPKKKRKHSNVIVTLLSRETKYRKIINEAQLMNALQNIDEIEVQKVSFTRDVPFLEQLEIIRNTDVLIGMHGAGLTHLLFLPDWASLFELYNCEDPNCYSDLARLRGLKYVTWEKDELLKREFDENDPENAHAAHAKFTNYSFDVDEFVRLVMTAVRHVEEHPAFEKDLEENCVDEDCTSNINQIAGTIEALEYDESIEIDSDFDKFAEERKSAKEMFKDEL